MLSTKTAVQVNINKTEKTAIETSYSSPKIFAVGNAATLIQGPMNSSSIRDGYGQWYAYTYDR